MKLAVNSAALSLLSLVPPVLANDFKTCASNLNRITCPGSAALDEC